MLLEMTLPSCYSLLLQCHFDGVPNASTISCLFLPRPYSVDNFKIKKNEDCVIKSQRLSTKHSFPFFSISMNR
jgi:hypothetical protein